MVHAIVAIFACLSAHPDGRIAFVSGPNRTEQSVCVVDVATGETVRIGAGQRDSAPTWSPDGQWIAFESGSGASQVIRVVRADGTDGRVLAHTQSWNASPRWSPDGTRLVYSSGPMSESKIAVYDMKGDVETMWGGDRAGLLRPVWVNNDTVVALAVKRLASATATEIVLAGPDGLSPLPENAMPSKGEYAAWFAEPHPKAFSLLFETNDGGDREIYVIALKRGALNISNHRASDWAPRWSPDGRWVAFESFRDGRRGVYRVNPDTVLVQPLAVSQNCDHWAPAWSPNSQWIAFVSDRSGTPELYVTDLRAKQTIPITANGQFNDMPAWRPRGKGK